MVGCKVAVWGDMLRVIEALMRQGRVAGSSSGGQQIGRVSGRSARPSAGRWLQGDLSPALKSFFLKKSDFYRVPSPTD